MAKASVNAEVLERLKDMVIKEAQAGTASGVPGNDTKYQSVSEKTETINKNEVKPESNPQNYDQKGSNDPSKPTDCGKCGEEQKEAAEVKPEVKSEAGPVAEKAAATEETSVAKLGQEILEMVNKFASSSVKPVATGKPGKDTGYTSVSEKTEHVNKNEVKPESNPQDFNQKASKDPAKPVASAKSAAEEAPSAEEVNKIASFELGRQLAEVIFKQAQVNQLEQIKEAGRRDFEALIAQAAQELQTSEVVEKQASEQEVMTEKQAEEQGAAAFQEMLKQAQIEYAVAELVKNNQELTAKLAALEKENAEFKKQASEFVDAKEKLAERLAEEREAQKMAALADYVTAQLLERLKSETVASK